MPRAEPLRGEIWDVRFPGFGEHPAAVMSVNPVNVRLTHVRLAPEAGLTRYDESYADVTGLQPIARGRLRRRRGLLSLGELAALEGQLRTYLGL